MNRTLRITTAMSALALLMALGPPAAMADPRGYMMSDEDRGEMMEKRSDAEYGYGRGYGYGPMEMHRGGMGHESRSLTGMLDSMFQLDLDDKQQQQLYEIKRTLRNSNWPLMGKLLDEKDQLHQLYNADELDAQAIQQRYGAIFDLKKQMIGNVIKAQNDARKLLGKEQLEKYRDMRRHMGYGYRQGYGMMGETGMMRGPGMMQ